jgi:hypothetical protein
MPQSLLQSLLGRPQSRNWCGLAPFDWAADLAPEHLQLMPKNEDLHLLRPLVATKENEQLEQAANRPVKKGHDREQQGPSTHPPTLRTSASLRPAPVASCDGYPHEQDVSSWDPHG